MLSRTSLSSFLTTGCRPGIASSIQSAITAWLSAGSGGRLPRVPLGALLAIRDLAGSGGRSRIAATASMQCPRSNVARCDLNAIPGACRRGNHAELEVVLPLVAELVRHLGRHRAAMARSDFQHLASHLQRGGAGRLQQVPAIAVAAPGVVFRIVRGADLARSWPSFRQ